MDYNKEFLNTLSKRLETNAIGYHLAEYAKTSQKEYRKAIISASDFYILEFITLLFIDYKFIMSEDCYFSNIQEFLESVCKERNINVNYKELTKDIVYNCFKNDGKILSFESLFNKNPVTYSIISEEKIAETGLNSFKLTKECSYWLYSTYELEIIGNISIENIILEKEIKSGNFENAKNTARKLLADVIREIKHLELVKSDIIANVEDRNSKYVYDNLLSSIDLIKTQQNDTKKINGKLQAIRKGDFKNINATEKDIQDNADNIRETSIFLDKVIAKQLDLLNTAIDVRDTYDEMLMDFSFLENSKYVNVKNDILKNIKKYSTTEFDLFGIISPLLPLNFNKLANINLFIKYQQIYNEKDDSSIQIEDMNDLEFEEEDKEKIDDINNENNIYKRIFCYILDDLIDNDRPIKFSECFNKHDELKSYLKEIKIVISILTSRTEVIFEEKKYFTKIEETSYIFEPEFIQFSCPSKDYDLSGKILTAQFTNHKIILNGIEEDKFQEQLKMDDIIFDLKGGY